MDNDIISDDIMAKILIVDNKEDSNILKKSFHKYGECVVVDNAIKAVQVFTESLENRVF